MTSRNLIAKLGVFLCGLVLLAQNAAAATVEKILNGQGTVILKLTPEELEQVKGARTVTITVDETTNPSDAATQNSSFANNFDVPFVFIAGLDPELSGSRALSQYFAAQSVRFRRMGGVFWVGTADSKSSEDTGKVKYVVDGAQKSYGAAPVFNAGGIRLGIGAAKSETAWKMTSREPGMTDKTKAAFDDTIIALSAATMFESGIFAGVGLMSHDYEVQWDSRNIGGTRDKNSESISEVQFSIGYAEPAYEAVLNYAPPINIREDLVAVSRPLTWTLNYRRRMEAFDLVAGLYQAYHSALSSAERNRQAASGGVIFETPYGSVGGLLNYATKFYRGTADATPLNIAHYGFTGTARYPIDPHSEAGFLLDYETGEDKGKMAGERSKLEHARLSAQVSYARYY